VPFPLHNDLLPPVPVSESLVLPLSLLAEEALTLLQARGDSGSEGLTGKMRRNLPVLVLALASNAALGSSPIYDESADASRSIHEAVIRADREDKRVLLVFGANWCGWCRELHRVFRSNPSVARRLDRDYVVVAVDVGRFDRNVALARRYGVSNLDDTGIPMLAVLDCRGTVVSVGDAGNFERQEGDGYDEAAVLRFLRENATP